MIGSTHTQIWTHAQSFYTLCYIEIIFPCLFKAKLYYFLLFYKSQTKLNTYRTSRALPVSIGYVSERWVQTKCMVSRRTRITTQQFSTIFTNPVNTNY